MALMVLLLASVGMAQSSSASKPASGGSMAASSSTPASGLIDINSATKA
jgi:hypothetical protein